MVPDGAVLGHHLNGPGRLRPTRVTAPERGWSQGVKASLGRVLVRVSSSRGFVEAVR